MILLSKDDIKKLFTMKEALEADKKAFALLAEDKCEVPLRTKILNEKDKGCFIFMPAYSEEAGVAALKIVNVFPNNVKLGLSAHPSQVLLINAHNGVVEALMDGTYITALRTGAASGLAFDLFAKKECEIGAIIGTGGQALCQLEAMLTARRLKEVRVCGRAFEHTEAFVDKAQKELAGYGAEIRAVKTSDEAVEDADLLITVTPSKAPVFDADKVKEGITVSCIGGYQPDMQELDSKIFKRCDKIYFDSKAAVLAEAGDILIPLKEGKVKEADFTGDIGEYLLNKIPGREGEDEIIVFKSVGVAAQDLVTAGEIYKKAVEAGAGIDTASFGY